MKKKGFDRFLLIEINFCNLVEDDYVATLQ